MKKTGLLFLLCLFAALCLFPGIGSAAAEQPAERDAGTPWQELASALQLAGEGETVTLTQSVTAGEGDSPLSVSASTTVILDLNGCTIDRGLTELTENGYVIEAAGSLTIKDSGSGGTITGGMNSGQGGGVYVAEGGSLTLLGGSISGNTAVDGGGVCAAGDFLMSGGSVSANQLAKGSAAYSYGGGVFVEEGATFSLLGGAVSGNASSADSPANYQGAGVYVKGTLRMAGGAVSGNGNTNNNNFGGGVFVCPGAEVTMDGASAIEGNISKRGGGVMVSGGTFTMNSGKIARNETWWGGSASGVMICDEGVFIMTGGSIEGNGSTNTGYGSGVCVGDFTTGATFTMRGGEISQNFSQSSAISNGSGVYVYNANSTFNLSGPAVIRDNKKGDAPNNVVLGSNVGATKITITGPLLYSGPIGVSAYRGKDFTIGFSDFMGDADPADWFVSESANTVVRRNEETGEASMAILYQINGLGDVKQNGVLAGHVLAEEGATNGRALAGTTVRLLAEPEPGWRLRSLTWTQQSSQTDITDSKEFVMPARAVTVKAVFELIEYEIGISAPDGGVLTAQVGETPGAASAHIGETVALTVIPPFGQEWSAWKVTDGNGNPVEVTDGAFTMPAASVSIAAEFTETEILTLPDSLTALGDGAFADAGAKAVRIPESCGSIGKSAFLDCGSVQVWIPAGCEITEGAFDGCEQAFLYSTEESRAEEYCDETHPNCVFVKVVP